LPVLLLKMSASTGFTRPCCLKTEIRDPSWHLSKDGTPSEATWSNHLHIHLLTECLSKLLSWFLLVLGNEGLASGVDGFLTSGATLLELPKFPSIYTLSPNYSSYFERMSM
jgi:hypothetical protein